MNNGTRRRLLASAAVVGATLGCFGHRRSRRDNAHLRMARRHLRRRADGHRQGLSGQVGQDRARAGPLRPAVARQDRIRIRHSGRRLRLRRWGQPVDGRVRAACREAQRHLPPRPISRPTSSRRPRCRATANIRTARASSSACPPTRTPTASPTARTSSRIRRKRKPSRPSTAATSPCRRPTRKPRKSPSSSTVPIRASTAGRRWAAATTTSRRRPPTPSRPSAASSTIPPPSR